MKRVHVYYSGRVQGVGFRFTAEDVAISLGLTGWIRNLPDGRVELVAEGMEESLKELLSKIEEYFKGYIRDKEITWSGATGEFSEFKLRFFR